ncbi:MAG: LytTR family transcriptional regulator [Reichenbachiella sp.]
MSINSYFKEWGELPFTFLDSKSSRWFLVIFCAIYSTFFIYYFNPLNIRNVDYGQAFANGLPIYLAGFIGAIVITFFEFVIKPFLKIESFTIRSFILWVAVQFIGLSIVMYLLFGDWELRFIPEYFLVLSYTLSLGLLPYFIAVLLIAVAVMRKRISETKSEEVPFGIENNRILLKEYNGKIGISLPIENVIMLKSDNNYTSVYYFLEDAVIKKLIRTNLKKLMDELKNENLIRVHRSYVINTMHVVDVQRKKGSYLINLNDKTNEVIKVSVSYLKVFEDFLKKEDKIHTK